MEDQLHIKEIIDSEGSGNVLRIFSYGTLIGFSINGVQVLASANDAVDIANYTKHLAGIATFETRRPVKEAPLYKENLRAEKIANSFSDTDTLPLEDDDMWSFES